MKYLRQLGGKADHNSFQIQYKKHFNKLPGLGEEKVATGENNCPIKAEYINDVLNTEHACKLQAC